MATAAAIDRIVHHSVILEFDMPSYRTSEAPGFRGDRRKNDNGVGLWRESWCTLTNDNYTRPRAAKVIGAKAAIIVVVDHLSANTANATGEEPLAERFNAAAGSGWRAAQERWGPDKRT